MDVQPEHPTEEVKRLQRCMNDLVSLLALPAMWSGGEPSQIVRILLDALLGMLRLDFVYVRLNDAAGRAPIEMVGVAQTQNRAARAQEIGEVFNEWLGDNLRKWPPSVRNPLGDGDISIVPLPLGLQGEIGVIVAGSQRADFPRETERLLLSVAANQAVIGLQDAWLLSEQKRAANELDRRVAQRTAELAAANEELEKEVAERRRAEDALRMRDLNSRLIVDSIPALVALMTPTGEIELVNRQVLEYFGRTLEEMKHWGTSDAVHPDELPQVVETFTNSINTGHPYEVEHRLRRFDGVYRWFQARALPLRDTNGRIVRWYVLLTDIDDRKRIEEVLHASERRLRLIFDGLPTLVTTMTPDGELENANHHVLEYFGATLEELKRQASASTFHPDDRQAVLAAWRESVETGQPFDFEGRQRRADGVYRWFHMRGFPLRDMGARIVLWYLLQIDIDDLKRAEGLLAGEKRLLELVAGGHPMSAILEALCLLVESTVGGCICSAVLVDPNNTWVEHGAAPSLPASFINSIVGQPVTVDSDPCAMAAFTNEQVIATNLASETQWTGQTWRPTALAHGLRACWATPISSTAGKVLGAFAIYYDEPGTPTPQHQTLIDQFKHVARIAVERAQSDAALRRSEARKAAILDSALDCIVTIDHDGCITEFNPAAERTFGYRRYEVVGKQLADVVIPPSLRDRHRRGLIRYLETGEASVIGRRVEITAVRADGSEFPVELAISRIQLTEPPSFTGYLRDITERKKSEEKLRESELNLRQMTETIPEMLWSATPEGAIDYCNDRVLDYTGFPAEEIMGNGWKKILYPDDVDQTVRVWMSCVTTGAPYQVEVRIFHAADRTYRWCVTSALPLLDQQRRILKWYGTVVDMHDWKQAQEELRNTQAELAHMTRVMTMGELAASIAHEVSQPLSGIITNASTCLRMLAADPPNIDGARETALRTIRDGNRAADVITRLRALFSKTSNMTQSVDLNEATQEVIALLQSELQRSRVILRMELYDDLPPVTGDRVQLQQVILNLLMNGSDAMSVIDDRPRQMLIRTERDEGNRVRLTVQDAGVGIEPQSVNKLFKAFYTTKSNGMGIGLSVSRSIIESHHGRIWAAQNNDGPGATFSFSIPCRPESLTGGHSPGAIRTPAVTDTQHVMRNS
jgi:PAS domain S-box-containing protein